MENDALIGYSGFIGSTLLRQRAFGHQFRSTNINLIKGGAYNLVVCAAAPAQKWIANRDPESDRLIIEGLIENITSIKCKKFILISTVDVYKTPCNVTESSQIDEDGLHAYGLHRRLLERAVEEHFEDRLIVRLPGLVGPGLRKNVIFDFLNENNVHAIDSRSIFQFYPTVNLWTDLMIAMEHDLKLVNLVAEPLSVSYIAKNAFYREFQNAPSEVPASYSVQSENSHIFGGTGSYQYSQRESLLAIRSYAQSEPTSVRKVT